MTEDKIQDLLRDADRTLGPPIAVSVELSTIRGRARKRQLSRIATSLGAGVVLIAVGFCALTAVDKSREKERIAALQMQVKRLQVQTDATLKLIEEVLESERRQRQLDKLYAELASIPDPLEEIRTQVDETGFILVYQADQMYRELKLIDSASRMYRRVIELFPQSRWAAVARQRLSEIQESQPNRQI